MKFSLKKTITVLFCIAYFLFLSFSIVGHVSVLNSYLKLATYISLILFFIIILLNINNYTRKEIIMFFILMSISSFMAYRNNDYNMFKLILFLFVMKNVDFEKCICFDLKARIILILLVLFLCFIGYAPDISAYNNGIIKHSLGFNNPNSLGMHTLILSFEIMYINKISLKKVFFSTLLVYIVNLYAGSRTTNLVVIVTASLYFLYKLKPKFYENKFVKWFIINSALLFTLFTLIGFLLFKYNTSIGVVLNKVLSNRLFNINSYYEFYSINLFGNNISTINLTIDTSYAYCLYGMGIVGLILFIVSFKKLFRKLYKYKNYSLIIIMFSFIIYGLSERLWMLIDYNIFMASFIFIIYTNTGISSSKV